MLSLNSPKGSKFIILYIKQNFGMSATRLCKSLIYFCVFKETVAVLYGNTYYETPCMNRDNNSLSPRMWKLIGCLDDAVIPNQVWSKCLDE